MVFGVGFKSSFSIIATSFELQWVAIWHDFSHLCSGMTSAITHSKINVRSLLHYPSLINGALGANSYIYNEVQLSSFATFSSNQSNQKVICSNLWVWIIEYPENSKGRPIQQSAHMLMKPMTNCRQHGGHIAHNQRQDISSCLRCWNLSSRFAKSLRCMVWSANWHDCKEDHLPPTDQVVCLNKVDVRKISA